MKSLNSRRTLLTAVFGAALLSVAGSALAAGGKGPAKAKVVIKGSESVVPNAYLKIGFHFDPGTVPIRSGGTVTLTNTTTDGHTLSIVKQSQLPRTIKQIENCSVCGAIAKSHGINLEGPPTEGPPPIPTRERWCSRVRHAGRFGHHRPQGTRRSGHVQGHRPPRDGPDLHVRLSSMDAGTLPGQVASLTASRRRPGCLGRRRPARVRRSSNSDSETG